MYQVKIFYADNKGFHYDNSNLIDKKSADWCVEKLVEGLTLCQKYATIGTFFVKVVEAG